jgi:hypothetical protein
MVIGRRILPFISEFVEKLNETFQPVRIDFVARPKGASPVWRRNE